MVISIPFTNTWAQSMAMNGQMNMSGTQSMAGMTMSQMSYMVIAGGKNFTVNIVSNGKLPASVQFNQDTKSLSFNASGLMSANLTHYEVTVPSDLLSGNFTAILGNSQIKIIQEGSTFHINVPVTFVKSNNIGDSSVLVITGTEAIPEFPISVVVAMLSAMVISVVFLKTRTKSL